MLFFCFFSTSQRIAMSMRLRGRHATAVGVGARLAASCLIFQDDVTVGRGAQVSQSSCQAGRESFNTEFHVNTYRAWIMPGI